MVDAQPASAGRLALDEAISLHLSIAASIAPKRQEALSWQPAILGRLDCDEYALTFEPIERYQRDTDYRFSLTPPLQAKDGAPLLFPFRRKLRHHRLLADRRSLSAAGQRVGPGRFGHYSRL